jgi:hypothetical protein
MSSKLRAAAWALGSWLLALPVGCTLVVQGTSQDVLVKSEPPGAVVTVAGKTGVTPVTFNLPKEDHVLDVRREGYHDARIELGRHISPWFIGSIVMGVIASGADILAGSWKEFDQTELLVVLEPLPGTVEELAVDVASEPPGAEVLVGDVVYGRAPGQIRLPWPAGDPEKILTFRLAGYRPKTVALRRGEKKAGPVALDPLPVRVATTFTSTPPGALVRVGARVVGRAPVTVDVEWLPVDGPRPVEFSLDGHHPETRELAPRQAELAASLREVVEEIALKVGAEPKGAKVTVDGVPAGEAPLEIRLAWSLSRPRHVIVVSHPGYATRRIEVLRADAAKPLDVRLDASP